MLIVRLFIKKMSTTKKGAHPVRSERLRSLFLKNSYFVEISSMINDQFCTRINRAVN
ncbi:hypothetical protein AWA2045_20630 [Lactiplantibacillus plantarum]|nr:hypothetical protein AWA2045_20630 [Lactiplantibacillus plantarum]